MVYEDSTINVLRHSLSIIIYKFCPNVPCFRWIENSLLWPKIVTLGLSLLLPFQSRRGCHSCIQKGTTTTMTNRIERRKRPMRWSRVALMGIVLLSDLRQATARTWEVLVEPSTYILIDRDMIRQIPESDPIFTETQLGTDAPTQMPVPTPSPVPVPTSAPSVSPTLTPTRTVSSTNVQSSSD